MNKRLICIGGASLDVKCLTQEPVRLGTSNPISTTTTHGGVARNVAENLAKLTENTELITVVGEDDAGVDLLQHMRRLGVNVDNSLVLEGIKTAHYYAIVEPDGRCHAAFADMGCFDAVTLESLAPAIQSWSADCIIFLDTNLPEPIIHFIIERQLTQHFCLVVDPVSVAKAKKLPQDLQGIYVLKPNQAEASILSGIEINTVADAIAAGQQLLMRGIQHVIISLAEQGIVVIDEHQCLTLPAHPVDNVIDVNGAGDAFCAGLLHGLQHHLPLTTVCQLGLRTAAYTLQTTETVASQLSRHLYVDLINTQELIHANIF